VIARLGPVSTATDPRRDVRQENNKIIDLLTSLSPGEQQLHTDHHLMRRLEDR
jgi:hypothetical protein